MKIGIVVPIAYLDRWGYQRNAVECIDSFCAFADTVALVQSIPIDPWISPLLRHENLSVYGGEDFYFPDGRYDTAHVARNRNIVADLLREEGCDVILHLDCNWYIPEGGREELRQSCHLAQAWGWAWLYRGDMLQGALYGPSYALPNIHGAGVKMADDDDSIIIRNGQDWRRMRGYWPQYENAMVVDTAMELTWWELAEKCNFVRCYSDLAPDRSPIFDRAFWEPFYQRKYAGRKPCRLPLDSYGQAIAARTSPDMVSASL